MPSWTALELKKALDLSDTGMSYAEIGAELGKTGNAIGSALRRTRGKVRFDNYCDPKVVKKLHKKGWIDVEIADHIGCSPTRVGQIRKQLELPANITNRYVTCKMVLTRAREASKRKRDAKVQAMGWVNTTIREATLLNELYVLGEATREQLALALKTNQGWVSTMALRLTKRGMVKARMVFRGTRKNLYSLEHGHVPIGPIRAELDKRKLNQEQQWDTLRHSVSGPISSTSSTTSSSDAPIPMHRRPSP